MRASPPPRRTTRWGRTAAAAARRAAARPPRAGRAAGAGFSSTPLPSVLTTETVPRRGPPRRVRARRAGNRPQLQGSQNQASTRRRITSTGSRRPEGPQPHPAVAHRQVGPLDQRVPEVGGQEGVLEGRLAPRPGGEQHDAGVIHGRAGRPPSGRSAGPGRTAPIGAPASRGTGWGTPARRPPGSRGRTPPRTGPGCSRPGRGTTVAVAGHVDGVVNSCWARARRIRSHWRRNPGWPNTSSAEGAAGAAVVARPVQVGEHQVEQLGPLDDAGLDRRPTPRCRPAPAPGRAPRGRRRRGAPSVLP